jgi:hypothetical protein
MVNAFAPSGLILDIYRSHYSDSSLDGISSRADRCTLVGTIEGEAQVAKPLPGDSRVFQERDNAPAVALRYTGAPGASRSAVCLVPVTFDDRSGEYRAVDSWTMAGGTYAGTTDSRFSALVHRMLGHYFYGLVPVHDRIEN